MSVCLFLTLLEAADYNTYNDFEKFNAMEVYNPTIFKYRVAKKSLDP